MSEQLTGRELDAAVAERVMGWWLCDDDGTWRGSDGSAIGGSGAFQAFEEEWSPSTDIAAAWLVVSAMADKGWSARVESPALVSRDVRCMFSIPHEDEEFGQITAEVEAYAITAPEAICRAALAAIGGAS